MVSWNSVEDVMLRGKRWRKPCCWSDQRCHVPPLSLFFIVFKSSSLSCNTKWCCGWEGGSWTLKWRMTLLMFKLTFRDHCNFCGFQCFYTKAQMEVISNAGSWVAQTKTLTWLFLHTCGLSDSLVGAAPYLEKWDSKKWLVLWLIKYDLLAQCEPRKSTS